MGVNRYFDLFRSIVSLRSERDNIRLLGFRFDCTIYPDWKSIEKLQDQILNRTYGVSRILKGSQSERLWTAWYQARIQGCIDFRLSDDSMMSAEVELTQTHFDPTKPAGYRNKLISDVCFSFGVDEDKLRQITGLTELKPAEIAKLDIVVDGNRGVSIGEDTHCPIDFLSTFFYLNELYLQLRNGADIMLLAQTFNLGFSGDKIDKGHARLPTCPDWRCISQFTDGIYQLINPHFNIWINIRPTFLRYDTWPLGSY